MFSQAIKFFSTALIHCGFLRRNCGLPMQALLQLICSLFLLCATVQYSAAQSVTQPVGSSTPNIANVGALTVEPSFFFQKMDASGNQLLMQLYCSGTCLTLTPDQVAQAAYGAGFSGGALVNAIAVASAESNFKLNAWCLNCVPGYTEDSRGLWQINVNVHPGYDRALLLTSALYNAQAAYTISNAASTNGANWCQWSTFTSGAPNGPFTQNGRIPQARTAAKNIDPTVIGGINDRVISTKSLHVRSTAGGATYLRLVSPGTHGTVLDGPFLATFGTCGSGLPAYTYIWWKIHWDDGGVDGWSVEDYMSRTASVTDTTPPTVPTGLTAVAMSSSQIVVNWNASSDNVGVTAYKVYLDGSQVWTGMSLNVTTTGLLASSTHSYNVSACDAAGNCSAQSPAVSVTTLANADTTPPSIAITSPMSSGQTYNTSTGSVNISGSASDNVGVTNVTWINDRGGSGTASGTTNWSVTGITLQAGYNTITVRAYDAAGNSNLANIIVNYTVSPNPVNGACGSSNGLSFSSQPTTNLCNSGSPYGMAGTGPWSWNCSGSNGGSAASCFASITPSGGTAPSCSITPTTANIMFGATQAFTANCTNSPSHWEWSIDGPVFTSGSVTSINIGATLAVGSHTVAVRALNASGFGAPVSATLTVNPASAPNCSLTPSTQMISVGGTATLTASCANPSTVYWGPTPAGGPTFGGAGGAATFNTAGSYTYSINNGAGGSSSATVTVNPSGSAMLPDLVITSLIAPSTGVAGGQISLSIEGANIGTTGAGPHRVGLYFSTDATITTGDTFADFFNLPAGLASQNSWGGGATINVPSTLASGIYYLGAFADDLGTVIETNENNNTYSVPITISGSSAPSCTLTPPSQVISVGTFVSLSASCVNPSTITWTNAPGGPVFSGAGGSATFSTAGSYTYSISNGTSSASATITVTSPGSAIAAVTEFYNTNLDNYFITADAGEAAAISSGSAGPGWIRTGYTFKSGGSTPVCRFYGSQWPGPNSHFYTVDANECAVLKQLQANTPATQKRWNFESLDFVSTPPTNGACPVGTVPVYRAYNNGFSRGVDSNHRVSSSLIAIQQAVSRGWSNEGVVMCAPQ